MSVLWSIGDWHLLQSGWTDACHPSSRGLDKYKRIAWGAMGRAHVLSIKIMGGWNFQEKQDKVRGPSFETYGR